MANINRDYLVINDVKKSNISLDNGSISFYITDKNTQNIFVNLVINISDNKLIQKYANIENAEDYTLTMHIVKPDNTYEIIQGKLHDKANAIFEFDLPDYCCDKVGSYRCELLTKCYINDREEITTSNKITYKVKSSVLNDLDEITEAPEYPIVIQLFDKLSDIEQYEEDRRANELTRQLAEKQRQTRFEALDADVTDSIQVMDDKVVEIENRVSTKEQAVDKLIVDTKADIDNYKVAKDIEIDEYKTAKDTEINNAIANQDSKIADAIANQDSKIDTAINAQNDRIAAVENNDVAQNNRLDIVENKNTQQDNRLNVVEAKNVEQDNRLDDIEAIDVAQNSRLDAIEVKNQQQDDRLLDVEKVNKRQDMDLKCLFAESKNNMMDVTEEGNSIYLQNSTVGYTLIDEIQGNTMVNCNKEPDKEITLNGNINTQGYGNVTLTEGVDGGLVDVYLEGNTMVNVCDQKDPVAITKSYTVETGNHVALQGEYDGKCRPVVTGKTLVNLITKDIAYISSGSSYNDNYITLTTTESTYGVTNIKLSYNLKSNTTYTLIFPSITKTNENLIFNCAFFQSGSSVACSNMAAVKNMITITTNDNIPSVLRFVANKGIEGSVVFGRDIIILEGDYTDKPIPDYFEGLQSSFEDNLVTQEMVDSGKEVVDNLGKYRVDYKVVGKNKFDLSNPQVPNGGNCTINNGSLRYYVTIDELSSHNGYNSVDITLKLKPNTQYVFRYDANITVGDSDTLGCGRVFIFKNNIHIETVMNNTPKTILTDETGVLLFKFIGNWNSTKHDFDVTFSNIRIEEGTVATSYEPYKEYKKTFYLNSPLLEGDTIEQQGDNVVHVHRSELRAYEADDELTLPTDKTNTLVAKASPQYEVISENDTILCDSYINGHLDVDSVVPIERVYFGFRALQCKYLYNNTTYSIQFESDNVGKLDKIILGAYGAVTNLDVVKGINKFNITTGNSVGFGYLDMYGIGFNASHIVVTEATDQDFGCFEGMKSVGECEELQVISINSERRLVNTQRLTHEPLRGTRNAKDRYVLIDGKWYIERKCGIRAYQEGDKDNYKTDLINTVYPLEMPTYEEIDYNPLEVYSGTTRITTNSVIPTNITVKNHGYNCLLKPNTTYTVSSNLGLSTVTTPSTLTEDCLRFYDTDTSDVTTMKDVTILEGDYTTGKPLPSHFSGIESAFEQEYNEEKGKYRVKAKVVGKNLFDGELELGTISGQTGLNVAYYQELRSKNYIRIPCLPFTISISPNAGGYIGLRYYDKNYKYLGPSNGVQHGSVIGVSPHIPPIGTYYIRFKYISTDLSIKFQLEQGTEATPYEPYKESVIEFYIDEPLRGIRNVKDKVYVKNDKVVVERNCGVRAYQDGDFGTYLTDKVNTVYQLAEPTYEEVEYNDVKLFIESFKNSTLFYNSNIPVTSTINYSYSVPLVDTVAQTEDISNQQDSMIIDLATQVAVMEMMLM